MKLIVQRVDKASVLFENNIIAQIDKGMLVFVGFGSHDTEEKVKKMAHKLLSLRIFANEVGKAEVSVKDAKAEILLVSQFTLYANVYNGTRPSFAHAMHSDQAQVLFNKFVSLVQAAYPLVKKNIFGTECKVSLVNDGPFTLPIEM